MSNDSKRLVAVGDQHGLLQVDPHLDYQSREVAMSKLLATIHTRGREITCQTSADGLCTIRTYLLDDQDKYTVSYLNGVARSISRPGCEEMPIEAFMEPQLRAINEVLDAAGVPEAPAETSMKVLYRIEYLIGKGEKHAHRN